MSSSPTSSMDSIHTKFDPSDYPLKQSNDVKRIRVKIVVSKYKGLIYYDNDLIGEVNKNRIIDITPLKQHIYNDNVSLVERAVDDAMLKINNNVVFEKAVKEIERKSKWCFCIR